METLKFDQISGVRFLQDPEVSREGEAELHHSFDKSLHRHVGGVAGFEVVDYHPEPVSPDDADFFPEHRTDVVGLAAGRLDQDSIRSIASMAYKHFAEIETKFAARQELLHEYYKRLKAGHTIINAYDHTTIVAGALAGVGLHSALLGYVTDVMKDDPAIVNGDITLNKSATRYKSVATLGLPISRPLALIWNVWYTIPPSLTAKESGINSRTRYALNKAMYDAKAEHHSGDQYGYADNTHGSGQVDRERIVTTKSGKITYVHLAPLATGVIKDMQQHHILPISSTLTDDEPIINIGDLREPVANEDEAHVVMEDIANMATESTDKIHVYHRSPTTFKKAINA